MTHVLTSALLLNHGTPKALRAEIGSVYQLPPNHVIDTAHRF